MWLPFISKINRLGKEKERNAMNRKLFIRKCYLLLWLNKCYVCLKQKFGIGFYTTTQQEREQNRMIKQAIHYNKYIIKPGDRYRSIVLAGRRY